MKREIFGSGVVMSEKVPLPQTNPGPRQLQPSLAWASASPRPQKQQLTLSTRQINKLLSTFLPASTVRAFLLPS
jgi:hypothetical protein